METTRDIPLSVWNKAYNFCVANGIGESQLAYWRNLPRPEEVEDRVFMAEYAWCVYNAGMKEAVVRSKWPDIQHAFMDFKVDDILACSSEVVDMTMAYFAHKRKAEAVVAGAQKVASERPMGERFAEMTESDALDYLLTFPYIGNVTRYHLARNIGFDVVKPDRHLVRLSAFYEYPSPDALVTEIAERVGERKGFIDYILWQWLAWGGTLK